MVIMDSVLIKTFKRYNRYLNKSITLKFFIYFILNFFVINIVAIYFQPIVNNIYINYYNSYFNQKINKKLELKRQVEFYQSVENKNNISIITKFYKENFSNYTQRVISLNLRIDLTLSIVILVSLLIATPIKFTKKLLLIPLGIAIIVILSYFKTLIFVFDNYTDTQFILIKLPVLLDRIVYITNYFYSSTGTSLSIISPFILWMLLLTFNIEELRKMLLN
jgi:hypothetical protein